MRIERFEEGALIYNRKTGETHLLNIFPEEILTRLLQASKTADAICIEMAKLCEEQLDDAFKAQVLEVLSRLKALGLVEANLP